SPTLSMPSRIMKTNPKPNIQTRKPVAAAVRRRIVRISFHRSRTARWWMGQAAKLLLHSTLNFQLSTSSASTITGTIQNTSGNAYATNALFAPLSTPLASGNNIIVSTPTNVVAAANGTYSVVLKQGNYLVTFGGVRRDSVLISVPDDANTYNLNSLITNGMT